MREPKRYEFIYNANWGDVEREEDLEGDYVNYADYARLKAEVERLTDKIRVSDNHAQCLEFVINSGTANELRLQAQVERLTKAGDELERVLTSKMSSYEAGNASFQWRAAKEGKQP